MTVNVIDTNTLVGLKAGADLYNANFTDPDNAASKLVGAAADQVPTNADVRNPRNRIVNPSMAISQENGFAAQVVPSNVAFFLADQFATYTESSTGAILNSSFQTLEGERSIRLTAATAATDLSTTKAGGSILTSLEKSNMHQLNGGDVAIAFDCRTNWTGKLSLAIRSLDNARTYVTDADVVSGVNHVFKVIPFEADTVPSAIAENTNAVLVYVGYNNEGTSQQLAADNDAWQAGAALTSTESTQWIKNINNYVEITNVDLYAGNVPREFTPNSYAYDLAECQRYWRKTYDLDVLAGTAVEFGGAVTVQIGGAQIGNAAFATVNYSPTRSDSPAITTYSPVTGAINKVRNKTAGLDKTGKVDDINRNGFIWGQNDTNSTAGQLMSLHYVVNDRL